jgi:Holliday junction resolvase
MAQRESRLSRKIQEALRGAGYFCFKVHGNELMTAGLPDIVVCARGLFIGIETKNPETRKNVSPRQHYIHEKIKQAGGAAVVVTSPDEALQVVADAITQHALDVSGYKRKK